MKKPLSIALFLALISPCAALAQDATSAPIADVNQSYRLLVRNFYKPVNAEAVLDAARKSILDDASKHHVTLSLADAPDTSDEDATLSWLDDAVTGAADATHLSVTTIAYDAMNAMAKSVNDRWTVFMTPDDYRAFNAALDPERISGIGVLIQPDAATNLMGLWYVVPGTPADRAGLQPGDILSTVDGTSTKGLKIEDVSKLLRGKAGTPVRVEVLRGNEPARPVDITRSEIQPPTVIAKMLPDNIGWVFVTAFGKETPVQFDQALDRMRDQGAKALVVDLRGNGGGYVDSALEMASRFIAHRPLLTVQQRDQADQTATAPNLVTVHVPVTVLVNGGTASASEIMAGALQDDGAAALVGARTFGKGVMQTLTPLPDGAAIKVTTAHYLTPARHDINLRGIDPDVQITEPSGSLLGDVSRDPQLKAAIAYLQKKVAEASKP